MQLFRLPELLILHLKRFEFRLRHADILFHSAQVSLRNALWKDKINTPVTFPLEGLDLSNSLVSPKGFDG